MPYYELIVEEQNPCGGDKYAKREVLEVEAESPEAYVRLNARFPLLEVTENGDETVITTGDGKGYQVKYFFTE